MPRDLLAPVQAIPRVAEESAPFSYWISVLTPATRGSRVYPGQAVNPRKSRTLWSKSRIPPPKAAFDLPASSYESITFNKSLAADRHASRNAGLRKPGRHFRSKSSSETPGVLPTGPIDRPQGDQRGHLHIHCQESHSWYWMTLDGVSR